MTLPRLAPMLATPGGLPAAAEDARWAYETKYDGQRAVAYLPGDGSLELRSRSGADITPAYPELRELAAAAAPDAPLVLDGEVIALDEQGHSDFQRLQSRMGLAGSPARAARMARQVPAHLVLFDVLVLRDEDVTSLPYVRRRRALEELELSGPAWSTPYAIVGHGEQALAATREQGLEGVVRKRLDSAYLPGVRSPAWVKIRNVLTADVVIGGWVPGRGRLADLPGAVLVGEPAPRHRLRYLGSVGTGWSDRERAELAELLRASTVEQCPFTDVPKVAGARWVVPRLVGEVAYSTRTRDGLLRRSSWHRLRPDLSPEWE